ncbi:homoserine kinase [Helicobacter sp. 12S02232-10]|uniref:homoserine kinase n=1 Tax=Helicobacter sp. 12S02232-10 TaxID=1476197 RepID=UPI000BA73E9B|nr:homoserine kinase [Helicobacter sp. 12S02232-10]PAF49100.1 homoserine kinase [Helicobacter sp. 12S02232-10]
MTISVPATSANLGPGFDSLGLSLDFRNYFNITPSTLTSIQLVGEGEGFPKFRVDNMFVKIFKKTLSDLGMSERDFRFFFKNKIPISRGMGSSSAVIVGAISAAHYLVKNSLDRREIVNAALLYESHPDNITPAVYGGFNVAVVEHKKVYQLKQEIPQVLKAVMVVPNRSISTKYSRQTLPKRYSSAESVFNLSRASLMSMAFVQGKWEFLRLASKDRFHQERRMKHFPILFAVQKTALENGALMSTLSGSGSSFFNMCYEDDAQRLSEIFNKKFPNFRVFVLNFDNQGVVLEQE